METRYILLVCLGIFSFAAAGCFFFTFIKGSVRGATPFLIVMIAAAVAFGFVDGTDDTPSWDERLEAKYGIEIGDVHEESLRQPGAWEIDGKWRTCMSPGFTLTKEDTTLLCQPLSAEAEFVELTK